MQHTMYCTNRAGLQVLLPDLYRVNMPVKVTGALQQEFDELILRFALWPGRHCAPSAWPSLCPFGMAVNAPLRPVHGLSTQ